MPQFIPKSYQPSIGFGTAIISLPSSPRSPSIFSASGLAGRQVWHISMPSSVPISFLTEIPLQNIATGNAAFSHKGADYSFIASRKPTQYTKNFLLPSTESHDYRSAPSTISRTFHLEQQISLPITPTAGEEPHAQPYASSITKRPDHMQPERLKMCNWLIGVSKLGKISSDSTSSNIEVNIEPQFRIPPGRAQGAGKEKSGVASAERAEIQQDSPTKKKRKRNQAGRLAAGTVGNHPVADLSNHITKLDPPINRLTEEI
jgi:hypothetical protein